MYSNFNFPGDNPPQESNCTQTRLLRLNTVNIPALKKPATLLETRQHLAKLEFLMERTDRERALKVAERIELACASKYKYGVNCCNVRDAILTSDKSIKLLRPAIEVAKMRVLEEETKEAQFLKEQEILNKTFETDKTEQQVAQELAKAKQELERLKVEQAKASAATRLAEQGDMASARALMGVQEAEGSWKKPVIISGIIVAAATLGFGIYKMVK